MLGLTPVNHSEGGGVASRSAPLLGRRVAGVFNRWSARFHHIQQPAGALVDLDGLRWIALAWLSWVILAWCETDLHSRW